MHLNLFFDWYAASIPSKIDAIINSFMPFYENCVLEITSARNGYTHADNFVNQHGEVVLTFYYGGAQQGDKVFAFASGSNASRFSDVVRECYPEHLLVRADVAIDFDEKGAWESLYGLAVKTSEANCLGNRYIGTAGAELADEDEKGRTIYVGSRSSVSMIRVYEKGKKDDKTRPNWVRAEFEFKPQGAEARAYFANASLIEIVNATKLGKYFFSALGAQNIMISCRPGTIRTKSDHDRALAHLIKQYRNVLMVELQRQGGSYEKLGMLLIHGEIEE